MKLTTLNLWGGRLKEAYGAFFQQHPEVDIWCFQEVYKEAYVPREADGINRSAVDHHLFDTLKGYLKGYQSEFCQTLKNCYGTATFIREDIRIVERGETLVARGDFESRTDLHNIDHHRKLFWHEVDINGKRILIINTHLTHRPEGKLDSDKRLKQSKILCDFLGMFDCPKILMGDFNLLPDTESIRLIEAAGMKNLVKEYGIRSTRTEHYKKPLKFADYIFISDGIKVNDFKVLPDVVSDHAPLFLDFEVG